MNPNQTIQFKLGKKKSKFFLSIIFCFVTFFPDFAYAASAFITEFCNLYNITSGSVGKIVAAVGVISVGVGFFTGRVSWGIMIGVCTGIAAIYGAPTIVAAVSGQSFYECSAKTYTTNCSNGQCYSCPMGFTGTDCQTCATGFTGPNCSDCITGYTGESCSDCLSGYTKYNGACHPACTTSGTKGIRDGDIVSGGIGTKVCNADHFTGTLEYSCLNGVFTATQNGCACTYNFSGSNCSSCATGYSGTTCSECSSGYIMLSNQCTPICYMSNIEGVVNGTEALPPNGTVSCGSGYSGTVDYSCSNGSVSVSSSSCLNNHCTGGQESVISVSGVLYKVHTFKSSGSFSCAAAKTVEYLVVGGGGGGGTVVTLSSGGKSAGGGGGAGGLLSGSMMVSVSQSLNVTVGSGGSPNNPGGNSSLGTIVAYGGGLGAYANLSQTSNAILAGGSGGGGANAGTGGTGVSGQGRNGGTATMSYDTYRGGGGGGAGGAGGGVGGGIAGNGGTGSASSITGTQLYYAGGGGGGGRGQRNDPSGLCYSSAISADGGNGGSNVGGKGGMGGLSNYSVNGESGAANTGSGGGGAGTCGNSIGSAGSGASGIVVLRYIY